VGDYVSYDGLRIAKAKSSELKQWRFSPLVKLKEMLGFGIDLYYKEYRQNQVYKRVEPVRPHRDHGFHLEET
jgi:hypothetical protein